jgi:Type IV secretion-system coupling protein DNA-binding domain
VSSNWLSWLKKSPKDAELLETLKHLQRLTEKHRISRFSSDEKVFPLIIGIIDEIEEKRGTDFTLSLRTGLFHLIYGLLAEEVLIGPIIDESVVRAAEIEELVLIRKALKKFERFLGAEERLLRIWREKLIWSMPTILSYFPDTAFIDPGEDGSDDDIALPEAHAFELCEKLPEMLERVIITLFDDDITNASLFKTMRESLDTNILSASGFRTDIRYDRELDLKFPTQSKITETSALVDAYFKGTPFQAFFYTPLPFAIPFPARFEHTHIVGGTGHGKTQLMQFLIHHDLVRAQEDGRSVVILDSQGDLIRAVSHLDCFSDLDFSDRFVLVDPNDVEHPVCLNMFDFSRDRLSGYAPVDREKILNATVELYEYFFGALLGAELTQRQGLIFRYLARLLIEIPNATIHTLRELMENGEKFRPYMEQLHGTARSFFATQFFDPKFRETKKQILTRLWGVMSNASLERMFSHTENLIDIFDLMNQGKIIFINTAKDLLGQEGAAIFGRFFVALIAQASVQRAALPPHQRRPTFVYIDEAQDYFDASISNLLNQARKYRIGLVFAHQNLDQLSPELRASMLASTTIKFAGGLSAKDASTLDSEFRCDADYLLSQRKSQSHSAFACFVKNFTKQGLSISIPLGFVESQPQLSSDDYDFLIDINRLKYADPAMDLEELPFPVLPSPSAEPAPRTKGKKPIPTDDVPLIDVPVITHTAEASLEHAPGTREPKPREAAKPKVIAEPGRGGRQHKYIQHLLKQLAEERGFRATIEETILDGAGRVDVSLRRDNLRVACQISITTTKDWELGGIEKCFAAGYSDVVLIGGTERHVKTLSKFIEENLDEKDQGKVRYVTSESMVEFLDDLGRPEPTEKIVRGYKVRTVQQSVDSSDAAARRRAITEVIARSMKRVKEE